MIGLPAKMQLATTNFSTWPNIRVCRYLYETQKKLTSWEADGKHFIYVSMGTQVATNNTIALLSGGVHRNSLEYKSLQRSNRWNCQVMMHQSMHCSLHYRDYGCLQMLGGYFDVILWTWEWAKLGKEETENTGRKFLFVSKNWFIHTFSKHYHSIEKNILHILHMFRNQWTSINQHIE